jgi:hypothetical protein
MVASQRPLRVDYSNHATTSFKKTQQNVTDLWTNATPVYRVPSVQQLLAYEVAFHKRKSEISLKYGSTNQHSIL